MVHGLIQPHHSITLPMMVKIHQRFASNPGIDVSREMRQQYQSIRPKIQLKPGARIAIAVGSRGIANVALITKELIDILKHDGYAPFIVSAMGSHGSATEAGQRQILAGLGISEKSMGVNVVTSLDVVELDQIDIPSVGLKCPVFFDKTAYEADGLIIVNRIKPHTLFRASVESGLIKMLTIGLGNHMGASAIHAIGFDLFDKIIPMTAKAILKKAPFLFGVAILENAYESTHQIQLIPRETLFQKEKQLLVKAKQLIAKINLNSIDLLIVREAGKEYSGDGMDPNVTGRYCNPTIRPDVNIERIVLLSLSDQTAGNATGIGSADVITQRCYEQIDFNSTLTNALTAKTLRGSQIPAVIDTDREAIQVALASILRLDKTNLRIVYIPNTLELETMWVSEPIVQELMGNPSFLISEQVSPFSFDEKGRLIRPTFDTINTTK